MPLKKSASKAAIASNIREMQNSGRPHDVAVAAALHTADVAKAKGPNMNKPRYQASIGQPEHAKRLAAALSKR